MNCRICLADVQPFLSFGQLPLGNAFLKTKDAREDLFDLTLGFCENCTLVQSVNPLPPTVLQDDYRNYRYTPVGDKLRDNLTALGREVGRPGDFVVDLGSNDGCLLQGAKAAGARVLGVEPAEDISEKARKDGIPTVTGFFTSTVADRIVTVHGLADVVTCTQTLQHVPDPVRFVDDVAKILRPGGYFVIEGRYFVDTVESLTFDTVYHEMMSCFTLSSLLMLLEPKGFSVERAMLVPTYGGSLRVYAQRCEPGKLVGEAARIDEREVALGVGSLDYYAKFAGRVAAVRDDIRALVLPLVAQGARIAGFGAPSTSATLLGYCGIGSALRYIVDDNPLKQGAWTPGTRIPIVPFERLEAEPPDYIFLCAWQFKDQIIARTKHLDAGYILPIPPQVVRA